MSSRVKVVKLVKAHVGAARKVGSDKGAPCLAELPLRNGTVLLAFDTEPHNAPIRTDSEFRAEVVRKGKRSKLWIPEKLKQHFEEKEENRVEGESDETESTEE